LQWLTACRIPQDGDRRMPTYTFGGVSMRLLVLTGALGLPNDRDHALRTLAWLETQPN
jgi:hypothetical protein